MISANIRQTRLLPRAQEKEVSTNSSKMSKKRCKLINEEVTNGTKGMVFQGKKFLEEKLQKNF